MCAVQVFFVRGVEALLGRGSNGREQSARFAEYVRTRTRRHDGVCRRSHRFPRRGRWRWTTKTATEDPRRNRTMCGMRGTWQEAGKRSRALDRRVTPATRQVTIAAALPREEEWSTRWAATDDHLERTGKTDLYVGEREIGLGASRGRNGAPAKQRSLYEMTDAIRQRSACVPWKFPMPSLQRREARSGDRPHLNRWPRLFVRCCVILEPQRPRPANECCGRPYGRGFRVPPFAADESSASPTSLSNRSAN